MWLIDFGSTLSGKWFCDEFAPAPRGRTRRACTMPGARTLWMEVYVPITFAGMAVFADGLGVLAVLRDARSRDQPGVRRPGGDRHGEVEFLPADQVAELDGLPAARDDAVARAETRDGNAELGRRHAQELLVRV